MVIRSYRRNWPTSPRSEAPAHNLGLFLHPRLNPASNLGRTSSKNIVNKKWSKDWRLIVIYSTRNPVRWPGARIRMRIPQKTMLGTKTDRFGGSVWDWEHLRHRSCCIPTGSSHCSALCNYIPAQPSEIFILLVFAGPRAKF